MRKYPIRMNSKGKFASMHLSDRSKRKWLKRRGDEFIAPSADLRQMCEEAGYPEYFNSLRNRIFKAMEEDHSLTVSGCLRRAL